MSVFVENSQLWVAGGLDNNENVLNDTWSSSDGVTWTQQHFNRFFGDAFHRGLTRGWPTFGGSVWVAGGVAENGSLLNDVWNSSDGANWFPVSSPGFSGRQDATLSVFDNLLFLAGGMTDSGDPVNDVWYSPDGTYWKLATNAANFSTGPTIRAWPSTTSFG